MGLQSTREAGQLERMISLAYLLTTRDEIAIDELEERFSVNSKQIEEDLNQLMFCGLPPYSPEQLFDISIEDGFVSMFYNDVFVSPLKLNDSERTNATVALTRLKQESDIEQSKQIDEILSIINSSKIQALAIENSSEYFDLFQKAIDTNSVVSIIYLSLNSGLIDEREVEPKKILTTASSSYIHAYCRRDKVMKLFRTDRITKAYISDVIPLANDIRSEADINSDDSIPFISSSSKTITFKIEDEAAWLIDTYPVTEVDITKSFYSIEISNPFVAARILLNASPHVKYIGGDISKEEILEALTSIKSRIN
jgi:predicted DNA-binding transcriptional regulator YafY